MVDLSEDELAQGLHVALGAIFILLPVCWQWHMAQAKGTIIGLAYAFIKEFWWDLKYESLETSGGWEGSFRDFCFYVVGIVAANVLVIF